MKSETEDGETEAIRRMQREENGIDPLGYTPSSWKILEDLPAYLRKPEERFILAFEPFYPVDHGDIGHQDPNRSSYRVLELSLADRRLSPESSVLLDDVRSDERYILCHGEKFTNQNPVFDEAEHGLRDEDFNLDSLGEHHLVLGRQLSWSEGYEPVGVNVVAFIRDKYTRRRI